MQKHIHLKISWQYTIYLYLLCIHLNFQERQVDIEDFPNTGHFHAGVSFLPW